MSVTPGAVSGSHDAASGADGTERREEDHGEGSTSRRTGRRAHRGLLMTSHDDPRHGTDNGYTNLGCRCAACREALAARVRTQRERRKAEGLPADDPRHGRATTYSNWGCRCSPCTAAATAARRGES